MKQHEAVVETIERLGGIVTLGQINQEIFKIKECEWKTKTPYASIRRIVQQNKDIYKIKPGLYALTKYKNRFEEQGILPETVGDKNVEQNTEFNHSYYQGLILEIGNMRNMTTYLPAQDKNKLFLNKPLASLASTNKMYDFTYPELVNRAKTIDVIWFNERKFMSSVFEVEHSTDIQNSLLKFNDLRDFNTAFYVISSAKRREEFVKKINYSAFSEIRGRVEFRDYDQISNLHTKMSEFHVLEQII